jgi:hypothetical protein
LAEELEKQSAGATIEQVLKGQSKDSKREKRRLDRRKMDVLNKHIFPSMANLILLVEYMAKNRYVNEMFEDLKALFLSTSSKVEKDKHKNTDWIFQRFIFNATMTTILGKNEDGVEDNIPLQDYRLILCDIMQQAVYRGMLAIGPHRFHHPQSAEKILMTDMERAFVWTQEISNEPRRHLHLQNDTRPPQF